MRELSNGMVYLRHAKLPSQIINVTQWRFLQICEGRSLEELAALAPQHLGFQVTVEQLQPFVEYMAEMGLLEGTTTLANHRRVVSAFRLTDFLAPVGAVVTTVWFAGLTLLALLASVVILIIDWHRFIDQVALAARQHPFASIALYYLTFIPIALLHELGHALVIRHYGGEVPEIVIRRNGHFAVLSNATVLKERKQILWYLSMGSVVDVYIWLALLVAFHFSTNYLLLMFLLPQTIYALLYSYSIFNNSDYLKIVATWLGQPTPARPWDYVKSGWRKFPDSQKSRRLLYVMTVSLVIKLVMTVVLIWTFLFKEYRVLILYFIYKAIIYMIGHWRQWIRKLNRPKANAVRMTPAQE